MKTLLSALFALCIASVSLAQTVAGIGTPKRTPEELQTLLAPIALYPDSLVALILPASTASADVVLAARYFADNGDPNSVDAQPWEESVRNLARYPGILKWMDENLEWTRELGEAFVAQPADVMMTIQKIRVDARARGLLVDTPQQQVVEREGEICILPASSEVIYVPYYDPETILLRRPRPDVWLTFSVAFPIGDWLFYDCDWSHHTVWVYRRPHGWVYHPGWRWHEPHRPIATYCDPWRPSDRFWHHERSLPRRPEHRVVPHAGSPRGIVDLPPSQWRERDRNRPGHRDGSPGPRNANWNRNDDRRRDDHRNDTPRNDDRRTDRGDVGARNRVIPAVRPSNAVQAPAPAPNVTAPDRQPDTRSAARWRELRERRTAPAIAEQPRIQHSAPVQTPPVHTAPVHNPSVHTSPPPQVTRTERIGAAGTHEMSRGPARVDTPAPRFERREAPAPRFERHEAPPPPPANSNSSSNNNNDNNRSNSGAAGAAARAWRNN